MFYVSWLLCTKIKQGKLNKQRTNTDLMLLRMTNISSQALPKLYATQIIENYFFPTKPKPKFGRSAF